MKRAVAVAALALVVLAFVAVRGCSGRINAWDLVNAPPPSGPIVCFGDSLVAGIGADSPDGSYPRQLERLLGREVLVWGTSGLTSAEGFKRLQDARAFRGGVVVVTLGGNDIIKQTPWRQTNESLGKIFQELQARGALVAFTGVEGPIKGTRGKRYRELCRRNGVILIPDILGGILANDDLKADQIHPNDAGYRLMAQRVAAVLGPLLTQTGEEDAE